MSFILHCSCCNTSFSYIDEIEQDIKENGNKCIYSTFIELYDAAGKKNSTFLKTYINIVKNHFPEHLYMIEKYILLL